MGGVSRGPKPDLNVLIAQHVRICGLTFKPGHRLLFKHEDDSNSAFCFVDVIFVMCLHCASVLSKSEEVSGDLTSSLTGEASSGSRDAVKSDGM